MNEAVFNRMLYTETALNNQKWNIPAGATMNAGLRSCFRYR